MKRIISILFVMTMLSSMANAGSIEDLQTKDRYFFQWESDRTNNDYDVTIDADTVQGYTVDEFLKDDASTTILAHGGSMSTRTLGWYLIGDADFFVINGQGSMMSMLDTKYMPLTYEQEINRKFSIVESKLARLQERVTELENTCS